MADELSPEDAALWQQIVPLMQDAYWEDQMRTITSEWLDARRNLPGIPPELMGPEDPIIAHRREAEANRQKFDNRIRETQRKLSDLLTIHRRR